MKKAIAVSLLISILVTAFTGVAFAMTEEEVLEKVRENEGKYEMGGPLTKDDFLLFSTDEDYEKYDYDMFVALKTGYHQEWFPNTQENLAIDDDIAFSFTYTYRGIAVDDRDSENRVVDPVLYSKDTVLIRYGIGVSGNFDPQTDELYKRNKTDSSFRQYTTSRNSFQPSCVSVHVRYNRIHIRTSCLHPRPSRYKA